MIYWLVLDMKRSVKEFIKMLRDREFWKIFRESLRDLGRSPYG